VREALLFSAALRLSGVNKQQLHSFVDEVRRDSFIMGLPSATNSLKEPEHFPRSCFSLRVPELSQ
jgi:hypothetical protein